MHRLAPLYLALPKLVPRLLKELLRAWSVGGSKETCLLAFAGIRQLAAEMPPPFIDTCLKGTYLAFALSFWLARMLQPRAHHAAAQHGQS